MMDEEEALRQYLMAEQLRLEEEEMLRQLQQQQPQQSRSGMSPGMIRNFIPQSGAGAGTGAGVAEGAGLVTPATAASSQSAGAAMSTGGAAAGGGSAAGGSALAAAGPWAALAAAIAANEHFADQAGRRGDSDKEHLKMALTGEGLEADMEYYGDKIGGPVGKMVEIGGELGNPKGALRNMEKALKPWEWF